MQGRERSQASPWKWIKVTGAAAWNPCDGSGALVYRDRLWLLGGWNPNIS